MLGQGHGTYDEVAEGEFLEATTKGELVVAHFFHRDFQRCRALDGHLAQLAPKYFMTRFIKLSAPVRGLLLVASCPRIVQRMPILMSVQTWL